MTKNDVSYQDKLNELRLDVTHPNSNDIIFILLEGESDIRLFRKLFNLNKTKVENIPGGKFKLEECIEELSLIYKLIFGIRDADFDHLNNKKIVKKNVILTDKHDMEMCILYEDEVLHSLVHEFSNYPKDKHFEIRDSVIKTLNEINLLKWLNDIENLELNFVAGFIDLLNFEKETVNFDEYFNRVLQKSPNAKITDLHEIKSKIKILEQKNPDKFQITNGHDFILAISVYFKNYGDTRNINSKLIQSFIRGTYNSTLYFRTNLYIETVSWCKLNNCVIY